MDQGSKITVFGGDGLLGRAICKVLDEQGYNNVDAPSLDQVNLLDRDSVDKYLSLEKPDNIFVVGGLVGGIGANRSRPADFLYQNAQMALNLFESVRMNSPESKILYRGASCSYPKHNPQPIEENRFMEGKPEKTSKGYSTAKTLGVVACEVYRKQYGIDAISFIPANLYGPGDDYDLESGHMIAGLIKKFLLSSRDGIEIILWGSGNPRREALHSEDCADAAVHLMRNYSSEEIINIGTGTDYSIIEFAEILKERLDIDPKITWDVSRPDGALEKRLDTKRLMEAYPNFNPRSFGDGLQGILDDENEVRRILYS